MSYLYRIMCRDLEGKCDPEVAAEFTNELFNMYLEL